MLWKLMVRYLKPYWPLLIAVVVFQAAQSIASLYLPTLNASIIDDGLVKGDVPFIWSTGGWMLLITLGQVLANIIAIYCGAMASMKAGRDLRASVFGRVVSFSEREVGQFGTATLITRNTNDVQQVQMLILMTCTMLVSAPMLAIGGVVMALQQDANLSWLIAVSVPLLVVCLGLIIWRLIPVSRRLQDRLDTINRVMREQLTGIRVIRAFVRENRETKRFDRANADLTRSMVQTGNLFVLMFPIVMLILNASTLAVLWFGAHLVDSGDSQIGTVMAFIQYLMQILMGVMMATFMFMMIPRASVSADRIGEVLDTTTSIKLDPSAIVGQPTPGLVEFRDVEFRYPGADEPILQHITFTIVPGTTTAIIGSTGSGKSTLINLIPRLFDATTGEVLVGGVPVKQADAESLWRSVALVPQKAFLFSGTIRSNMRYGNEDASDEAIWRALEVAQAADFVRELDHGLDERVAQGGSNFSGGQKQRLAIARALVAGPSVLIFDDSFSALDLTTDARLRAALQREAGGLTQVVVAQRVSSIEAADQIIVLEDGRIVGIGTHDELAAGNDTYREIIDSQRMAEGEGPVASSAPASPASADHSNSTTEGERA